MAAFITRVELHGADASDYTKLHGEMEQRGFSRVIVADDGVHHRLPTAEYACTSNLTAGGVREVADQAIAAVGKTAWVITALYTNASFRLPTA